MLHEIKEKSYSHREKNHYHGVKKLIKIRLQSDEIDEIKVDLTMTFMEMRRFLSEKYKIPL